MSLFFEFCLKHNFALAPIADLMPLDTDQFLGFVAGRSHGRVI